MNKYFIFLSLFLVGCSGNEPNLEKTLRTYGPDKYGVVCYRLYGTQGISCVKVQQ